MQAGARAVWGDCPGAQVYRSYSSACNRTSAAACSAAGARCAWEASVNPLASSPLNFTRRCFPAAAGTGPIEALFLGQSPFAAQLLAEQQQCGKLDSARACGASAALPAAALNVPLSWDLAAGAPALLVAEGQWSAMEEAGAGVVAEARGDESAAEGSAQPEGAAAGAGKAPAAGNAGAPMGAAEGEVVAAEAQGDGEVPADGAAPAGAELEADQRGATAPAEVAAAANKTALAAQGDGIAPADSAAPAGAELEAP